MHISKAEKLRDAQIPTKGAEHDRFDSVDLSRMRIQSMATPNGVLFDSLANTILLESFVNSHDFADARSLGLVKGSSQSASRGDSIERKIF